MGRPRAGIAFGEWLTDGLPSAQVEHLYGHESSLTPSLLTGHVGWSGSISGLEMHFNTGKSPSQTPSPSPRTVFWFLSKYGPSSFGPSVLYLFHEAWIFLNIIVCLTRLTAPRRWVSYLIQFSRVIVSHLKRNSRWLSKTNSSIFDRNTNHEKTNNKLTLCFWDPNSCENHPLWCLLNHNVHVGMIINWYN